MIVDIKVDLSECFAENFEYDSELGANPTHSLSDEVVEVVKYEVKRSITEKISSHVIDAASKSFKEFGDDKIKAIVDYKMDEFIKSGMVKSGGYNGDLIPVEDRLRAIFDSSSSWNNATSKMEEIGKRFSDECRKRYDLAFASNIVSGLEKQGLLKAGVFEALTNGKDS